MGRLDGRGERIFELLEQAKAARESADAETLSGCARSMKSLVQPEKHIGMWAWSAALTPGPAFAPALAEVERWIRTGDEDDVRTAAMMVAWRASDELGPMVEPLASRLAKPEPLRLRLFCVQALYALARIKVPIAAAFPALFTLIEEDGKHFPAASFAIDVAHKNGESFAPAADWVARTVPIRWESADIYADLLESGFVPRPQHAQPLQQTLYYHDERNWRAAVPALTTLLKAGENFDDFVNAVIKRAGAKTAKEAERGLYAVRGLVTCGVPLSAFLALLERALSHKVLAVRQATHRTVAAIAEGMTPEERLTEERAAKAAKFDKVAELLAKEVAPKAARKPPEPKVEPPALDVEALSDKLRGDTLIEIRGALYTIVRADRAQLELLVPSLVDALATEERHRALDHLTRGLQDGLELRFAVPIVAGLLLDRDYYDQMSLAAILGFLLAALDRGYDISLAWPWIPSYLAGERCQGLRFQVAAKGLATGLDHEILEEWLMRWFVEVDPTQHPSSVADAIQYIHSAGTCLAISHQRRRS